MAIGEGHVESRCTTNENSALDVNSNFTICLHFNICRCRQLFHVLDNCHDQMIFKLARVDRLLMCWWMFTGLTHMVVEGYFVFTPDFFKEKTTFYLAELWKEYGKGDSRYVARDSVIVSVEGITAVVEGPLCILAVYAIAMKKSYSYILQLAISLGQLYGTAVYFLTSYLEGDNFATNLFYYYAYYVFANSFWILIPSLIVMRCWKKISAACRVQDNKGKAKLR